MWAGQPACPTACHRVTEVPSRGWGGRGAVGRQLSGRGATALPVGLQSATDLTCSLNLPRGLGGGDCHPQFADGETEALGIQDGAPSWASGHPAPASHGLVSVLCPGEHWTGRSVAGWGSSLCCLAPSEAGGGWR